MRLLFLAVLRPHTGNAVTAKRVRRILVSVCVLAGETTTWATAGDETRDAGCLSSPAPRRPPIHGEGFRTAGLRNHLEAAGHVCILKDASDAESASEIANLIMAENLEAALALHLYRSGRLLQGHGIPFGVIFGGTDLNEDANHREKNEVMGKVLEEARFAVAFTESMKELAQQQWPHAKGKIFVQSQGIATTPNSAFNWDSFLQKLEITQSADSLYVFLLICGLRPVKDPLYLVDAFSEWHQEAPNVYMVIVGPEVDPVFTKEVKARLRRWKQLSHRCLHPSVTVPITMDSQSSILFLTEATHQECLLCRATGVRLIQEMSQGDLHTVMKSCFALVNSSISEGMSAAILEAMDLEVPVLARNIPGNAAVVEHGVTGLLFTDPEEFVQLAKKLISDPTLEREMVTNGREYVKRHHSWHAERETYQRLITKLEASLED